MHIAGGLRRDRRVHRPAIMGLIATMSTLTALGCSSGTAPTRHTPAKALASPVREATAGAPAATPAPTTSAPSTTDPATTSTTIAVPSTTTTQPALIDQAGWTIVSRSGSTIVTDTRSNGTSTGDVVTLVRFRAGTYRLDLHVGSTDPPSGGVAIPAVAGDAVSPGERPGLLGAFNGGFKANTGAGGFEVDGRILTPLVAGDASLVIDAGGNARVGVWGQDLPVGGEQVQSVRQNLRPLIHHGQPSPASGNVAAWGATLGGVSNVARSAVGVDAAGDLIYAGGMHLLPVDLIQGLTAAGALDAMELDINPEWVQADVAAYPGGPLRAAVPGQQRWAGQYLSGWTRDFLAVIAGP